jgi:hypothetical protein
MKFTINRKTWLRGEDNSALFRPSDGKKCCLGFYALACGLKVRDIKDQSEPIDTDERKHSKMAALFKKDGLQNALCYRLMKINDNENTTDARKEKAIKNNFTKVGVGVEFVG